MSAEREPDSEVGRFRLVRKLGEGGMGEVWSAVHAQTRKTVALKLLKTSDSSDPLQAKRFLREARAASAVRHPNVVQIHDVIELPNGEVAIVMDLLQGEDLSQHLERRGALPTTEVASLMLPVLEALTVAHAAGVVHRDLKPENIFLDQPVAGRIQPKVLDFGIAKLTAQSGPAAESMQLTRTGTVMGSPYYMSPEQVFGEADLDRRSDVWSVGVILYEALSGQKPFGGENFGQLFKAITQGTHVPLALRAPHLPPAVIGLVGSLLQTDRALRAADLKSAMDVLGHYVGATSGVVVVNGGLSKLSPTAAVDSEFTTGPTEVLPVPALTPSTRSAPIRRPGLTSPKLTPRRAAIAAGLLAIVGGAVAWFAIEPEPGVETSAATGSAVVEVNPMPTTAAVAEQAGSAAQDSSLSLESARAGSVPSASSTETVAPLTTSVAANSGAPEVGHLPPKGVVRAVPGGSTRVAGAPPAPGVQNSGPPVAAGAPVAEPGSSSRLPGSVVSETPF